MRKLKEFLFFASRKPMANRRGPSVLWTAILLVGLLFGSMPLGVVAQDADNNDEGAQTSQSVYLQEKFDEGFVDQSARLDFHFTPAGDAAAVSAAALSAIASDDFNQSNLDLSTWTFVNPLNDGAVTMVGAGSGDAHMELSVPEGPSHDAWNTNRSVRVMQAAPNGDLDVIVKFDSTPSEKFQMQGIIAEQDEDNWIRMELHYDGEKFRIFTAATADGVTVGTGTLAVTAQVANYLRVTRTGNEWSVSHSGNGVTWSEPVKFTHALTLTQIGPFVSNHAASGNAPAFVARVDYFENTASPISGEDSGSTPDTTPPFIHAIEVTNGPTDSVSVNWHTDEPSSGKVDFGPTNAYGATVNSAAGQTSHLVELTGLTPNETYHMRITARDADDNSGNSGDIEFVFEPDNVLGPNIDVWYGDTQQYGQQGVPQEWANIVGNASDGNGVVAMSYRLNGGPPVKMSIGPDGRRLENVGDFNVDVAISALQPGNNTVQITATDSLGNSSTKNVTLNYQSGNVWPLPYSIDWSTLNNDNAILTRAQIVDGKWRLDGDGVRTDETGYDRFVGFGDRKWNDYEVTVPVTVNALPDEGQRGFGVVLRWQGHSDVPHVCTQPKCGWLPIGVIAWLKGGRLELYGNDGDILDTKNQSIAVGQTYWIKARVETNANGGLYSMKFWPQNEPEPSDWSLSAQESLQDPQRGSALLIAHQADVTFGNVAVTPTGTGENFSPVANDDEALVAPNGANAIHVLENDTDAGGLLDPSTVVVVQAPTHGTTSVDPDTGDVLYQHNGDASESDSFRYQVTDDEGAVSNAATVSVTISPDASGSVQSDDFSYCEVRPFWTQINPFGEGTVEIAGAGTADARLLLSLPSGTSHNVWTAEGNTALRLMQDVSNTNFSIDVHFKSEPLNGRNDQGILVEEDGENFLRFDAYNTGDQLRVFAGSTLNGTNKTEINASVPLSSTRYLRVERSGSTWTFSHSADGEAWNQAVSFETAIVVNRVGIYAANTGGLAFSSEVDYFFNTANPINPEDGARNTLTVNGPNGTVTPNPAKTEYACGEEVELTAEPYAGYTFTGWSGDLSGTNNPAILTIKGSSEVTAIFTSESEDTQPPVITLIGANPLNHEAGTPYTDPGAVAFDNVDGDISADVVIGGDTVDPNTPGSYLVSYDVTDAAGNKAVQRTRTVRVADTTPPVITLLGNNPLRIPVGGAYTDPGATAQDSFEGDLTANILRDESDIDTSVAGTYVVTYDVSDSSGNRADQVTRTVIVGEPEPEFNTFLPLVFK